VSEKLLDKIAANKAELQKLCNEFDIELLVAFGSVSRGDEHDKSDIDLAYAREARLGLQLQSELSQRIRETTDLPGREIDLIWLTEADPLHLRKISEDAALLVGSERRFQQFKHRAFHKYSDFKPYLDREKETTARRLEALKNRD
jgi:predicted nucleotidyltransferase